MLRIIIFLLLINSTALSHSGRTNSEGCHNNRKTGSYHCHGKKHNNTRKTDSTIRRLYQKVDNNFKCENKTVCADMQSCAEAKFYLKKCRIYKLDRDNDGIPCENVCT
jgi:hypothetical protein